MNTYQEKKNKNEPESCFIEIMVFSIYTLSDLGISSNLIGLLSLANEHYSPPTEGIQWNLDL